MSAVTLPECHPVATAVHPLLIPLLRTLSDGQFHSGANLAKDAGVSRATVCNILKQSEPLGIHLHKVQGHGYQLPDPPDWLDAQKARQHLRGNARGFHIETVDETLSTNTVLLHANDDTPTPRCLAAEIQTAGRGRRGRQWHASLGSSLTCSVRWRSRLGMAALAGASLAAGIATLRALKACHIHGAQLKWPNDILWHDRKLAGILTEVQGDALGPSTLVIGIGINVRLPGTLRNDIDQPVADLTEISGQPVSRNQLLAELLNAITDVLAEFETSGLDILRHEWESQHAFDQQQLDVTLADGRTLSGTAIGLSPVGALLIRLADGHETAINSGDVQRARPSAPGAKQD